MSTVSAESTVSSVSTESASVASSETSSETATVSSVRVASEATSIAAISSVATPVVGRFSSGQIIPIVIRLHQQHSGTILAFRAGNRLTELDGRHGHTDGDQAAQNCDELWTK
uniref:Uncharacterized protein n=1 Tax=Anopheles atroparvus TaxID=41427 RepID=A0A182J0A3_ANOAO